MPFTPFYMGPAATCKAFGGSSFSLMLFGYSQILIDIEALVHIYRRDAYLHGFPHSFLGETLIGVVALVTGKPICEGVVTLWSWLTRNDQVLAEQGERKFLNWRAATVTVLIGVWSHVILDAIMHEDMRPFSPFSEANPFLHVVSNRGLHQFCLATGILGGFIVFWRYAAARSK